MSGTRFKILFVGLCAVEISGVAFKTLLLLPAAQSKTWKHFTGFIAATPELILTSPSYFAGLTWKII